MMLHAAAAGTLLAVPAAWPVALGLLLADHAALAGLGMLAGSALLGPSLTRLPASAGPVVALTFDDGPHPVRTPQVLDLLDRAGARASFFCVGRRAERHPDLVADIVARGHSVENHSFDHALMFAARGPWALRRDILRAQAVLAAAAGTPPRFMRAPFGIRSPLLDPALAGTGLIHAGWTRRGRDTVCADAATVLRRLTDRLGAGEVLLLHDATSAVAADGRPVVLEVLPRLLATLAARGLRASSLREAVAG